MKRTLDASITVKLTATQKRRIELLAEENNKSSAEYIRMIFESHLHGSRPDESASSSNEALLERISRLESEISKVSDSLGAMAEQTGVYRQQFRGDVISFFKMILFNPKFLLKDLKPRERDDVIELLKAVFPDDQQNS